MDESVHKFLRSTGPVLCVDIGSGTQDALLARPGLECENWPRFVLPSPARMVAQRIRELTLLRRDLWLYGGNMGGGFGQAVKEHLGAGFKVWCTPAASRGIRASTSPLQVDWLYLASSAAMEDATRQKRSRGVSTCLPVRSLRR